MQDQDGGGVPKAACKRQIHDIGQDVANIYAALTKISSDVEDLAEIRRTTTLVEMNSPP